MYPIEFGSGIYNDPIRWRTPPFPNYEPACFGHNQVMLELAERSQQLKPSYDWSEVKPFNRLSRNELVKYIAYLRRCIAEDCPYEIDENMVMRWHDQRSRYQAMFPCQDTYPVP